MCSQTGSPLKAEEGLCCALLRTNDGESGSSSPSHEGLLFTEEHAEEHQGSQDCSLSTAEDLPEIPTISAGLQIDTCTFDSSSDNACSMRLPSDACVEAVGSFSEAVS